ncbi:MAG: methionyl-tRNA formyltransferase [Chitinophagaceae bacterium]|nr:methionyl-tRNA formyltransferase [Chitinophagaceae bacterium]
MGTPEFAVASLDKLVQNNCNIVGVITAPDKPAGRGMELQQSAVKKYAADKGLHILQPEKLKNPEFLEQLKSLQADVQIVVAFRMLPEIVWNMPPMGTINVHGSLLPQYRGAAPINWAIINGEKETGVTTFKLQQEIDTGNILLSQKIEIGKDETAGELHDKMKEVGAELLLKTLTELVAGNLTEQPQIHQSDGLRLADVSQPNMTESDEARQVPLNHAPKIFTETCKIDWNKTVNEVYNLIRGLSPYPSAFCFLDNKKLKIYTAKKEITQPIIKAGQFDTDKKTYLKFACINGYIFITELQLEGKKKMLVEDFLRGYRF